MISLVVYDYNKNMISLVVYDYNKNISTAYSKFHDSISHIAFFICQAHVIIKISEL